VVRGQATIACLCHASRLIYSVTEHVISEAKPKVVGDQSTSTNRFPPEQLSINISNTYLNGELKNVEVYMWQPEGFAQKDNTWVAHLLKGLYSLKQGGREWFKWLKEALSQLGFACICADSSVFIWAKDGVQVICPVFVDNITFASKSKAKIAELKTAIAKHFKLRNLGPTTFHLGLEIIRNCKACTLRLLQHCYCLNLLECYGFTTCSPVSMPLNSSVCLSTTQAPQTPEETAFMRAVIKQVM
jgi:hypothetical protein